MATGQGAPGVAGTCNRGLFPPIQRESGLLDTLISEYSQEMRKHIPTSLSHQTSGHLLQRPLEIYTLSFDPPSEPMFNCNPTSGMVVQVYNPRRKKAEVAQCSRPPWKTQDCLKMAQWVRALAIKSDEFDSQDPHNGKGEPTPASCSLISIFSL